MFQPIMLYYHNTIKAISCDHVSANHVILSQYNKGNIMWPCFSQSCYIITIQWRQYHVTMFQPIMLYYHNTIRAISCDHVSANHAIVSQPKKKKKLYTDPEILVISFNISNLGVHWHILLDPHRIYFTGKLRRVLIPDNIYVNSRIIADLLWFPSITSWHQQLHTSKLDNFSKYIYNYIRWYTCT